jgi:transposase
MSDAEWAVIEPLLPAPGWTLGRGGSPGSYCRRDIVNAIRYLTHNGCVWRALPADLPHWRTVYHYVRTWQKTGATRRMHDTLREQVRVLARRGPQPTAAIIDSQSVKLSTRGPPDPGQSDDACHRALAAFSGSSPVTYPRRPRCCPTPPSSPWARSGSRRCTSRRNQAAHRTLAGLAGRTRRQAPAPECL